MAGQGSSGGQSRDSLEVANVERLGRDDSELGLNRNEGRPRKVMKSGRASPGRALGCSDGLKDGGR